MSATILYNNEVIETIQEITLRDTVKLTFSDEQDTESGGVQAWEWEVTPPQGSKSTHAQFEEDFTFDLISLGYDIGGQYKVSVIDTSDNTEVTSISLNVIMSNDEAENAQIDENIIENLVPFVAQVTNITAGNTLTLNQSWSAFRNIVQPVRDKLNPNAQFNEIKISYRYNNVEDLNTYLHFGDDNKFLVTNVKSDRDTFPAYPYSAVFRLYEPLPEDIDVKSQTFVVKEVLPQVVETVELFPYEQEDEGALILKTPDTAQVESPVSERRIPAKSFNELVTSNKNIKNQILDKFLTGSQKPIELNADYSEYKNFVNFSSAEKRLENFKYKIQQIESNNAKSSSFAAVTSGSPDATLYENRTRNLKSNFDGYDNYLYNVSSSYFSSSLGLSRDASWPKTGAGTFADPYVPVSSSNTQFTTWYGSVNSETGQIYSASLYDKTNPNRLVNLLPDHIREDTQNSVFLDFMDMVGQHFDELWLYTKNLSEITDRQSDLTKGFSKDLVFNLAKSMGWEIQDGKDLLDLSRYGFGQKAEGNSFKLYTSGSLTSKTESDMSREITKRLISSMPYILKTKGTINSLKAIINCYGIPSSILRVKEYGGLESDKQKAQFEIARKFTRALGFRGGQFIQTTWDDDGTTSRKPESIELRFRSSNVANQVLVQKDSDFAIRLKNNGLTDNNGTVSFMLSGSDGYKEISSSLLPIFDGDYYSVLLRKRKINSELFPTSSFEVGNNEGLFNPPFITGSRSAEFGKLEIVSSSNVARTGTKSLKHTNTSDDTTSYSLFYKNPDDNLYPGNNASVANVSVGDEYTFSVFAKASGSQVDSVASIVLFELDANEEVVNWTEENEYGYQDGGIKSSQYVGLNETEWKQLTVTKKIKFSQTTKLGVRFENRKPKTSVLFDDASLRKISTNTDTLTDPFKYDLLVKKYDSGLDRIRLASRESLIISSSISQSYNAAWTGSGNLFIGGNDTGSFSSNRFSGSMMEFRLWSEPLNETAFDNHVATPKSYFGNTVSSSYDNLSRRFQFDDNSGLAQNASIRDSKPNQNSATTGSAKGFAGANTFESVIDKTKTIVPNHGPNRRTATKIRIEKNNLSGSGASLSLTKRFDSSVNDYSPLDSPRLGIFFSPVDVINEDIVSSFANLDFNEYIGDPRDNFSENYSELKDISHKYFKKYSGNNNFFDYIRLIKYYDQNIFKQLRKVIPARAKANLGTVIEGNIFERPKSPVQRSNPSVEEPFFENTIDIGTFEGEVEHEDSRSIIRVESDFPNFSSQIDAGLDILERPSLYKFDFNDNYSDNSLYISGSAKIGGPDRVFQEVTGSIITQGRLSLHNEVSKFFYTSSVEFDNSVRIGTSAQNRILFPDGDLLQNLFTSRSLVKTDIDPKYDEVTALNNSFYEGVKNTRSTTIDGDAAFIVRKSATRVAVPTRGDIGKLGIVDE